jgi:hypothetical protein
MPLLDLEPASFRLFVTQEGGSCLVFAQHFEQMQGLLAGDRMWCIVAEDIAEVAQSCMLIVVAHTAPGLEFQCRNFLRQHAHQAGYERLKGIQMGLVFVVVSYTR